MTRLALVLLLAGCAQSAPVVEPSGEPTQIAPRVEDSSQFDELDGVEVRAVGTYVQVDVRKRVRDDDQPVYRGHTAVRLADGHRLHIEATWSDAAIRHSEEIAEFEGQRVVVRGTLHSRCPTPPEPMAAIISPCLTDVRAVARAAARGSVLP